MRRSTPDEWTTRRVVVVVAHPDDEILGCGSLLCSLGQVQIVHVTNGAPRGGADASRAGFASCAEYAAARQSEALAALTLCGVPATNVRSLGIADQTAAEQLAPLARSLVPILAGCDVVLTHSFEGGHPDHDAVAFAVQAARRLCGPGKGPDGFEMPFYYGSNDGWVRQQFLPRAHSLSARHEHSEAEAADSGEIIRELTPAAQELKRRMLAMHRTQAETLSSFVVGAERFRPVLPRDFAVRPHAGPLLYERHGWNLTWSQWLSHVDGANVDLGLAPP